MARRLIVLALALGLGLAVTGVAGAGWFNVIRGTGGNDVIAGTANRDLVLAFAGNDQVSSAEARDIVFAGKGDDSVDGGPGLDLLRGGPGSDTLNAGDGGAVIWGGYGNDAITGGDNGRNRLHGGPGDDTVNGGAGRDFRAINTFDERLGPRLRKEFSSLGWRTQRHVFMVQRRPPTKSAPSRGSRVRVKGRVNELEDFIARAEVIDITKLSGEKVKFGATVVLVISWWDVFWLSARVVDER